MQILSRLTGLFVGGQDRPTAAQSLVGLNSATQALNLGAGKLGADRPPGRLGAQGGLQIIKASLVTDAAGVGGATGPGFAIGQQGDAAGVGVQADQGVVGVAIGGLDGLFIGDDSLLGPGVLGLQIGQKSGNGQDGLADRRADGPEFGGGPEPRLARPGQANSGGQGKGREEGQLAVGQTANLEATRAWASRTSGRRASSSPGTEAGT